MAASCPCEKKSESDRIKCLIEKYKLLMLQRGKAITKGDLEELLSTTKLGNVKLNTFKPRTKTEELAECQIAFTFIKEYMKTHPQFIKDGPTLGDLHFKTNFFNLT